jgi:hypothetical protein
MIRAQRTYIFIDHAAGGGEITITPCVPSCRACCTRVVCRVCCCCCCCVLSLKLKELKVFKYKLENVSAPLVRGVRVLPLGSTTGSSYRHRRATGRGSRASRIVRAITSLVLLCRAPEKVQIVTALAHIADAVASTADTRRCLMCGQRHGGRNARRSLHGTGRTNAVKVRVAHGLRSSNARLGLVR